MAFGNFQWGENIYNPINPKEVVAFFKDIYKSRSRVDIMDQLWVLNHYHVMFDEATNEALYHPVQLVLKYFAKDKWPHLD